MQICSDKHLMFNMKKQISALINGLRGGSVGFMNKILYLYVGNGRLIVQL